jgi:hypothetical protein
VIRDATTSVLTALTQTSLLSTISPLTLPLSGVTVVTSPMFLEATRRILHCRSGEFGSEQPATDGTLNFSCVERRGAFADGKTDSIADGGF